MTDKEQKLIRHLDELRKARLELDYLLSFDDYTPGEQAGLNETVALYQRLLFLTERDLNNSAIMRPISWRTQ